jgi:8-oxo-dGTP pyrophosphatase MutT (NUDIX family)
MSTREEQFIRHWMKRRSLNRYAAHVAVLYPRNRILLLQRHPDMYLGEFCEFPGGSGEFHLSCDAEAARELEEETGLNAPSLQFFRISEIESPSKGKLALVSFLLQLGSETPIHRSPDEHIEDVIVPLEHALKLQLAPGTRKIIEALHRQAQVGQIR